MFTQQFKEAFRSVLRNKYYSVINIIGLAIGLAAFIITSLFVKHELSYDRSFKDYNNIYRVVRQEYTCSPPAMAPALKQRIPEIDAASRFIRRDNLLFKVDNESFIEQNYYWTDNEFFQIFDIEFLIGNKSTILKRPNDVVISESTSRKLFGNDDPLGKILTVSSGSDYVIAGVFKDMPSNTHFNFNIVFPIDKFFELTNNNPDSWSSNYTYSYIKVHNGADISKLDKGITELEKELTGWSADSGEPYEQYFFFQPIKEIHLYSHRQQELQVNGDIRIVIIFISIALLILFVASINYINLSTALAGKRNREIGIRKALGISKKQLISKFISESVIIALISTILATLIAYITLPFFGDFMDRELAIGFGDLPFIIPSLFLLSVFIGFITGLFPSRSVSGVSIIAVLRGEPIKKIGGVRFRNILVLSQFIIALVLIILTINVRKQIGFMMDRDPGYDRSQIITMGIYDQNLSRNLDPLKSELLSSRNILNVSTSDHLPHNIIEFTRPDWLCEDPNPTRCIPVYYNDVGYNYTELYNISISQGRSFSKMHPSDASGAFMLNQTAVDMAGWESPIGMEISHWDGRRGKIVGVFEDFHFQSLHTDIAPLYLFLDQNATAFLSIKISDLDIPGTIDTIKEIFQEFSPEMPFQYSFFDEEFGLVYESEERLASVFASFAILAVLLACLGLFSMSDFEINQRTKEMGIRKVFGSTNYKTLLLLIRNFIKPVLLANIIAWPVAYYSVSRWLENFAFKTDISVWSFILAAMFIISITIITISSHAGKVSRQVPAVTLKHE